MIEAADQNYYEGEGELMSDSRYDELVNFSNLLQGSQTGHTTVKPNGSSRLPHAMWSLNKKYTGKDIDKWIENHTGPFQISAKLDGVSGLYTTENSKPRLYTRGNGLVGRDISHLIPFLNLTTEPGIAVRGEFVISKTNFSRHFAEKYCSMRNLVAGIINQKNNKEDHEGSRFLEFIIFEVIRPDQLKPSEQLKFTKTILKQTPVINLRRKNVTMESLGKLLTRWKQSYQYDIDGVVCIQDKAVSGSKKGNPESAFAFKRNDSNQFQETSVVDVLWSVTKYGLLKPRIEITPVQLGSVQVRYTNGFNAKYISDNGIGKGTELTMTRAGEVIPHIIRVNSSSKPIFPKVEYVWTESGVDIELKEKKENKQINAKQLENFFECMNARGVGPQTIQKLVSNGYDTSEKVMKMLRAPQLAKIPGITQTQLRNICNSIQFDTLDLPTLMKASNIFGEGFGIGTFNKILDKYPGILQWNKLTVTDVIWINHLRKIKIPGVSTNKFLVFTDKIPVFLKWMKKVGFNKYLHKNAVQGGTPVKKFTLSGFRDKNIITEMKALGYELQEGVTKQTDLLIVKDHDQIETTKITRARDYNIPIYSKSEILKKIEQGVDITG
jgi:NAD-dependent DNA ligase